MWQRIIDRIAPLTGEDLSGLDRRDGVGTQQQDLGDTAAPVRRSESTRG